MPQFAQQQSAKATGPSPAVGSSSLLQRKCACGGTPGPTGECEECRKEKLQRKSSGCDATCRSLTANSHQATAPPIVHDVLNSPGRPLDTGTRAFFEPRFGHDLSRVRIHTDVKAAESAHAVNALAYTVGNNIVFGSGQHAPESPVGRRLIAHELAHTVQQRHAGPPLNPNSPIGIQRVDDPAEGEADRATDAAFARRSIPLLSHLQPAVARQTRRDDVQTLSDEELESEHASTQQWLMSHRSNDAAYAQSTAYIAQLESEISRRNPARIRAQARRQIEIRVVEGALASAIFAPIGLGAATGVFLYEFNRGVIDDLQEQPGDRIQRINERFRQLNGFGHWGDKFDYALGYLQGIALGIWGEIKGIVDLFILIPRLLVQAIGWIGRMSNPTVLLLRALELQAKLNRFTAQAVADLVRFFESPGQALRTLVDMFEGMISAGLGRAYNLGHTAVSSALQFAEGSFRSIGLAFGKVVGWVLFQIVLLLSTEAIGNLISRGAAVASRVLRGIVEGAATIFAEGAAFVGELISAVRGLVGNAVMRAFRATCDALIEVWEEVRGFFSGVFSTAAEEGGALRPATAGGGRPPPNVFMSEGSEAAGRAPVRTTQTTVDELYGRGGGGGRVDDITQGPRSTAEAIDELEETANRGSRSRSPSESRQLAEAGTNIQRTTIQQWADTLGARWRVLSSREEWPQWVRRTFPQGGPDAIAINEAERQIIVADAAPRPGSMVDVRPGMGRGAPASERALSEAEIVRAGDDGRMLHIEKTIDDANRIANNLPANMRQWSVFAREVYWELGGRLSRLIRIR